MKRNFKSVLILLIINNIKGGRLKQCRVRNVSAYLNIIRHLRKSNTIWNRYILSEAINIKLNIFFVLPEIVLWKFNYYKFTISQQQYGSYFEHKTISVHRDLRAYTGILDLFHAEMHTKNKLKKKKSMLEISHFKQKMILSRF